MYKINIDDIYRRETKRQLAPTYCAIIRVDQPMTEDFEQFLVQYRNQLRRIIGFMLTTENTTPDQLDALLKTHSKVQTYLKLIAVQKELREAKRQQVEMYRALGDID